MPFFATAIPLGIGLGKAITKGLPWYIRIGQTYQKFNKFTEKFGPLGYGFMYASGTVLGYQGTSQFFKPKWKYLGSPQRVSKL